MLRIDTSDRGSAVLILTGFALMFVLRIALGFGLGISLGFVAMAGLPLAISMAALFLRQGDGKAEGGRKALAVCAAVAAFSGCLFYGAASNELLLLLYSLLLAIVLAIWSGKLEAEPVGTDDPGVYATRRTNRGARWQLIAAISGVTLASMAYRWLTLQQLEQTAALFIGIPAALAIAVALTGPPRSAMGTALKATLLGLLVSGIFLSEGLICILMAAPLFLAVAALVGRLVDVSRRRQSERVTSAMLLLVFLPLSFEGVLPELSFSRDEVVIVTQVLGIGADQVRTNLERTPEFTRDLPVFLRLGFPRPAGAWGQGLDVGDVRRIRFAGGEGSPGVLTLEVAEVDNSRVLFRAVSDDSHIAHWLQWREAEVEWVEVAAGQTEVRWTLRYQRSLDPAWYFGPWERYGVRLAGEYLLETVTGS